MTMSDDDPEYRRPAFNDVRDDYDDDFTLTPRERLRRRVLVPGIAFLGIGSLGIAGMIACEVLLVAESLTRALAGNTTRVLNLVFGTMGVFLAIALFGVVVAGGVSMLKLRRRWLALFAAYVVTGLSLFGCYGILFYPFGIWALVLLYHPDVRAEFRLPAPAEDRP